MRLPALNPDRRWLMPNPHFDEVVLVVCLLAGIAIGVYIGLLIG